MGCGACCIRPARSLIKHQPDFALKYKTLLELLKLVLHKNNLQFNGEHYLQIDGTAMGTKVVPSYANLFMARLEEKLIEKARTDLKVELPLYLRYIDDIFFIFPYSETKLEECMTLLNSFHKTIIIWGTFAYFSSFASLQRTIPRQTKVGLSQEPKSARQTCTCQPVETHSNRKRQKTTSKQMCHPQLQMHSVKNWRQQLP